MKLCGRKRMSRRSPVTAGTFARAFVAFLFVFYINYVPFHLLTEWHFDDFPPSAQATAVHLDSHDDRDHGDQDDHHHPHSKSDHLIQLLPKTDSSARCVVFLPATSRVIIQSPQPRAIVHFVERIWPPGVSPPEPSQPRAPP